MEPPKKLAEKIWESCLLIFFSVLLIRFSVKLLEECWPKLLIIGALAALATIFWNICRHYHSQGGKW